MVSAETSGKIDELVSSLARVDGVAAIFLFGSHARGEATHGSDVDILVLFRDEENLWKGRKELFKRAAQTDVFVQILARSVEEFWRKTDPTFREEVLLGGRLVYLSPPGTAVFDPKVILAYDLRSLAQPRKMWVRNQLHRLIKRGGLRLGRGCLLLRREDLHEAEAVLRLSGASYRIVPALLPAVRPPADFASETVSPSTVLRKRRRS